MNNTDNLKPKFEKAMTKLIESEGGKAPNAAPNGGLFRVDSSGEYNTGVGWGAWKGYQAAQLEIAELTKQRDELKAALRVARMKSTDEMIVKLIDDALSTQEANKDEDGPLCDHGVKYHECKYNCIQF